MLTTTVETPSKPKENLLRYLRWRDLIVVLVGLALGSWLNHRYSFHPPTDYQQWQARPQLRPLDRAIVGGKLGQSGLPPCFFLVPKGVIDQPVLSGSVGDCLRLVPDGRKLDLFEIDLWGGFAHIKTDLDLADVMPLAFTRSVVPLDAWAKRHKVYLPHVYDPFLFGGRYPYTFMTWVLPDRKPIHFERISPGTSFVDAVYEAKSARDEIFAGSQIKWAGWRWVLSLENGTTFLSPEAYHATRPQQGSLLGIFDKEGREVRLSRKSSGDLREVESPSGHWIKFAYDEGRMVEARDSLRNVVEYKYDAEGRLVLVVYSRGSAIKYSYDSSNRVVRLEDSSSGTVLENKYSPKGIVEQTTVNGEIYSFRRLVDDVDITDPKGVVTRVHITAKDRNMTYTVEKVVHGSDR